VPRPVQPPSYLPGPRQAGCRSTREENRHQALSAGCALDRRGDFPVAGGEGNGIQRRRCLHAEVQSGGQWVFAGGLHPPTTATVVRVLEDEVTITDGPFSESKEQVGGFWVIKALDLDAALASAVGASRACRPPVEVRPFQDEPED
jgi:hypothetical protein